MKVPNVAATATIRISIGKAAYPLPAHGPPVIPKFGITLRYLTV
jgi:hypothetical protein